MFEVDNEDTGKNPKDFVLVFLFIFEKVFNDWLDLQKGSTKLYPGSMLISWCMKKIIGKYRKGFFQKKFRPFCARYSLKGHAC